MKQKYFWKNASGVNADIERHRKELADFDATITEIESRADERG